MSNILLVIIIGLFTQTIFFPSEKWFVVTTSTTLVLMGIALGLRMYEVFRDQNRYRETHNIQPYYISGRVYDVSGFDDLNFFIEEIIKISGGRNLRWVHEFNNTSNPLVLTFEIEKELVDKGCVDVHLPDGLEVKPLVWAGISQN